jgi:glyoxylase-like metal-dependent hydrolase (beta-lactamase superfamily II)
VYADNVVHIREPDLLYCEVRAGQATAHLATCAWTVRAARCDIAVERAIPMSSITFHRPGAGRTCVAITILCVIGAFAALPFLATDLVAQEGRVVGAGVISTGSAYEMNAAFSHGGTRLHFSRCTGERSAMECRILVSRRTGDTWSAPEPASFTTDAADFDPAVSHDGRRMVFLSRRPRPGESAPRSDWDIWMTQLARDEWAAPTWLGPPISTDESEYFASLTPDGDLVFSSIRPGGAGRGDIYIARRTAAGFDEPRNLGANVNSEFFESDPAVSADGRFMLFTSYGRPGAPGNGDLNVSYARNGGWLRAELLDAVNTPARECCATVSPDGHTLLFTREVDDRGQLFEIPLSQVGLPPVNTTGLAAPGLDSVHVEHVAGSVYVASLFTRFRANVTLSIGADGTLATDIPGQLYVDTLRRIVDGLTPYGIRQVVATHWHADHTGGNAAFGGDVPLIAHRAVRERRSQLQSPDWAPGGIVRLPRHALPDVTFSDSLALHWNGERVVLLHVGQSHTDSDAVVLFETSGVAVVGDLFHGRGRFTGSDRHTGDAAGLAAALEYLERRLPAGTRLVTGHGALSTLADLADYRRRYELTLARVTAAVTANEPQPALLAGVREVWQGWGGSDTDIERLLESLMAELARSTR